MEDPLANDRFAAAVEQVFASHVDISQYVSSGKTDTGILLDVCELTGVPRNEAKTQLKRLYEASIAYMKEHITADPPVVQRGVAELLAALSGRKDCLLGLLTGNLRECARLRLGDLFRFFPVGGFGEISENRNELVGAAIREATSRTGESFKPRDMAYFGDTPLDIEAGKNAGIVTVGVATGRYSREELEKANADFALTDLSNTQEVLYVLGLA